MPAPANRTTRKDLDTSGAGRRRAVAIAILLALLGARFVFHAIYVPAYEGPDEPFHLGRALLFSDGTWSQALAETRLPKPIVASVRRHPCGPSLQRAFDCQPFRHGGAFDILAVETVEVDDAKVTNYESHQPPLYYAVAGTVLRLASGAGTTPVRRLLVLRVFSLLLVLLAVAVPLRRLARRTRAPFLFAVAGLLLLLLPGASEALIRGSNDAALFLWAAFTMERAASRAPSWVLALLLGVGPMIKLTALPIVAVILAALWIEGRRGSAIACAAAAALVVPVQAFRGWAWGGTYELNSAPLVLVSPAETLLGLARSAYTFVKTIFWLGEWSFFRAPRPLVGLWLLLLAAGMVLLWREKRDRSGDLLPLASHRVGAGLAAAGFLVLAIMNRGLFGQWGGLGGWYAWGWAPWILTAVKWKPAGRTEFVTGWTLAAFVVLSNVLWLRAAGDLYGYAVP